MTLPWNVWNTVLKTVQGMVIYSLMLEITCFVSYYSKSFAADLLFTAMLLTILCPTVPDLWPAMMTWYLFVEQRHFCAFVRYSTAKWLEQGDSQPRAWGWVMGRYLLTWPQVSRTVVIPGDDFFILPGCKVATRERMAPVLGQPLGHQCWQQFQLTHW